MYWTYRDFDFSQVDDSLFKDMDMWWMSVSLVFGILSQVFRGIRWKQTLEPLGESPRVSHCIHAIFISYAANLLVPRLGEVSRCGVLAKADGVSFSKSLGTVVTERVIDTLCIGFMTLLAIGGEWQVFHKFFQETGTKFGSWERFFLSTDFYWWLLGGILLGWGGFLVLKRLSLFRRLKQMCHNLWEGILSVHKVRRPGLFVCYTILIWVSYLFHFYLTFFCFPFSDHLSFMAGLVMFVVGSIAVVIPTPNGAGPWHYAVITMMVLYGVSQENAAIFALLVHAIQTFLIILLGVYGLLAMQIGKRKLLTKAQRAGDVAETIS